MTERNRHVGFNTTERSLNSQKTYYRQRPIWTLSAMQRDKNKNEGGQKREKKNNSACLQKLQNRKILRALNNFLNSSWKYTFYHISEVLSFRIFLFCILVLSLASENCFLLVNTLTFQGESGWFQNCITLILRLNNTEVQWKKRPAINLP